MNRPTLSLLCAFVVIASAAPSYAELTAYEGFDYEGGVNLTTETANNGTGWTAAWADTEGNGLVTSGSGQSLSYRRHFFSQVGSGLFIWVFITCFLSQDNAGQPF